MRTDASSSAGTWTSWRTKRSPPTLIQSETPASEVKTRSGQPSALMSPDAADRFVPPSIIRITEKLSTSVMPSSAPEIFVKAIAGVPEAVPAKGLRSTAMPAGQAPGIGAMRTVLPAISARTPSAVSASDGKATRSVSVAAVSIMACAWPLFHS